MKGMKMTRARMRTITESEMATDRPSKSLINAGSVKGSNSEVVTIKTITKGNNKNTLF